MKTFQHFCQFLLFFLFHTEFHTLKRRQTEYSQHRFRIHNISSADKIHLIPEVAIISRIESAASVVPSILLFFLIHLMFFTSHTNISCCFLVSHKIFLLFISKFIRCFHHIIILLKNQYWNFI